MSVIVQMFQHHGAFTSDLFFVVVFFVCFVVVFYEKIEQKIKLKYILFSSYMFCVVKINLYETVGIGWTRTSRIFLPSSLQVEATRPGHR